MQKEMTCLLSNVIVPLSKNLFPSSKLRFEKVGLVWLIWKCDNLSKKVTSIHNTCLPIYCNKATSGSDELAIVVDGTDMVSMEWGPALSAWTWCEIFGSSYPYLVISARIRTENEQLHPPQDDLKWPPQPSLLNWGTKGSQRLRVCVWDCGPGCCKSQKRGEDDEQCPPSTGSEPEKIGDRALQGTEPVKPDLLSPRDKVSLWHWGISTE